MVGYHLEKKSFKKIHSPNQGSSVFIQTTLRDKNSGEVKGPFFEIPWRYQCHRQNAFFSEKLKRDRRKKKSTEF